MDTLIVLDYPIGSRVFIKDADLWGRVREVSLTATAKTYCVSWFNEEKDRMTAWFNPDELSSSKVEA